MVEQDRMAEQANMAEQQRLADQQRMAEQDKTDQELDKLGPVDFLLIEFPAGQVNFTGEIAQELANLADAGTIRVIDVLILAKDEAGMVDAAGVSDAELRGVVETEARLAELLAADEAERLAESMEPGSVAGVLIYENLWAAPFASASRRAGGQLIAAGRIPIQAIIASLQADARKNDARKNSGA